MSKKKPRKKAPKLQVQHKPPTPEAASAGPAEAERTATPQAARKPGIKSQVAALLQGGGAFTFEELMAATSGTRSSVQTAVYDLRSAKYCGPSGVLKIVLADGKYSLVKEEAQ